VDLRFSDDEEAFRAEARGWLEAELSGRFAALRGRGGPGDEHACVEKRRAWERALGAAGYIALGWPRAHGGREASAAEQLIFHEEYARARAPGRLGHIGAELVAPTLLACGSDEQRRRFLPRIATGDELWCQGYSEPDAGSDLASLRTRAVRDGDGWVVTGQKIWTSHAQIADWCLLLARTGAQPRHRGLSCLLVSMRQPGVTVRPIVQLTGTSEFSAVFFDGARADAAHVVGAVDDGWRVAMATLAVERGVSTLGQLIGFENELAAVIARARDNGAARDPILRQRLIDAWMGLKCLRLNALRALFHSGHSGHSGHGGDDGDAAAAIHKLAWSTWHQALGELAMDVLGADGELVDEGNAALQRLFLFSRADTIYAGTSEIQRDLIARRVLGLPAEPRS
jgi:alkylation response protein AidB-like acyl-CoA dehydrogenase